MLWAIVNVAMGVTGIVALGVALSVGGIPDLARGSPVPGSISVEGWQKRGTPGGYTIELDCNDGVTRSVECARAPDGSHECRCIADGDITDEFETRVEPVLGKQVVEWVSANCGWDLESNLSRPPLTDSF
jgi:hypothetical protein